MVSLENVAAAALRRDNLSLRSLVQDFLRDHPRLQTVPRPQTEDQEILGIAAGLLELMAQRTGQAAPDWTRDVGAMPKPFVLLEAALRMKRLRALCEAESPEPLRKRGLYAHPTFLPLRSKRKSLQLIALAKPRIVSSRLPPGGL